MSNNHVTEKLSAFCAGELGSDESRLVREHLLGCPRCRQVYEEIKLGVSFASTLKPVAAPPNLWSGIESRLPKEPDSKRTRPVWRLPAAAAAVLAIMVGTVWFARRDSTPTASLEVSSIAGSPVVASISLTSKGRLAVGQWLETDQQSRARITIADIGRVDVDANSRISLIATRANEHRLNLARGRLHAQIQAPPRLFIVETPVAVAVDLGCEYTLDVDESGGSVLRVTGGYVALEFGGRDVVVPAGAICYTRPGVGPGTPYFEDATEQFRLAIADFDLSSGREQALRTILAEARRRDTLTLWNLLSRVNESERGRVFDRLVELFAPPDGVTREGMLKLDRGMLELYRKRLEWVW